MKPKWEDAPEWAKWVAQDGDGDWYWFEVKPKPMHRLSKWMAQDSRHALASHSPNPIGPCEPRP